MFILSSFAAEVLLNSRVEVAGMLVSQMYNVHFTKNTTFHNVETSNVETASNFALRLVVHLLYRSTFPHLREVERPSTW